MEGDAQKCVEPYWELANKKVEQLYKVSYPYLDDHQFKQEELKSVGELSEVLSQNCLKNACILHEMDDLTSCGQSTSMRGKSQKWTQACGRRLARLSSYIHRTNDFRQCCHGTALQTGFVSRLRLYWRSSGLKVNFRRCLVFLLEAEHLSQSVGCARNKLLSRTVPQSLRSFL